jgi:acetyl esterase/lipase
MPVVVFVLCIVMAFGSEDAAAAHHPRRPVMLLMHAGGFVSGDASYERQAAELARRRGFLARSLEYPLWNLRGAVGYVQRAARFWRRAGHPVYAYGESAGGTLAALLAERGLARSAVAYAPVVNIPRSYPEILPWIKLSLRQARSLSPGFHRSREPILAMVPANDGVVDPRFTWRWARRDPLVRARLVPGEHGFIDSPWYRPNLQIAMSDLARQAR